MKKFQLAFLLLLFAGSAYAQFEDTKFVVGGAVDYNSDLISGSSSLGLKPAFAKTIKSNALLGLSVGYSTLTFKSDGSNSKVTINSLNTGIYYQRFYVLAGKVYFNWQALAGMSLSNFDGNSSTNESRGYDFRLVPGLSWKVMDKLLLSASLGGAGYSHQSSFVDSGGIAESSKRNQVNIRFNNPQFGVIYLIK